MLSDITDRTAVCCTFC